MIILNWIEHSLVMTLQGILHEKGIELKLSGNEVYYTACSLLVILNISYGEFHCPIFLDLI